MSCRTFKRIYVAVILLSLPVLLVSQDIISGFVQKKGQGVIALSFTHEQSTEFFVGPEKTGYPGGIDKYKVQSWSAYVAYGLSDNINVIFNLPYVRAITTAGSVPPGGEEKAFQDASIFLKWRPVYRRTGVGALSLVLAGGVTFPMSDYVPDTLVSIGNQGTSIDGRLVLLYKFNSGLFTELLGGYSLRSDVVPNAYTGQIKLGYAAARFFLEGWMQIANSTEGPDIGDPGFTLPATKVDFTRIGATLFYPVIQRVGVFLKWFTTLDGRNIKKANAFSTGLVFRF